ncbi:MAG: M56 family metallopeptidase, partial [Lachnospiraceae bacterium]|nr:M56 family metallopeptidase [Lachnospiraceae bacterium]
MQDFLNVQDFVVRQLFLPTLSVSLLGTLTGMFIAAIHPATRKYFSAKWNYYIWLLVVARLAVPFHLGSGVNLQLPAPFHSAQQGSVQNGDIHFGVENADARIPDPLLPESGGVRPTAVSADAAADGTLTSVHSSQTDAA